MGSREQPTEVLVVGDSKFCGDRMGMEKADHARVLGVDEAGEDAQNRQATHESQLEDYLRQVSQSQHCCRILEWRDGTPRL